MDQFPGKMKWVICDTCEGNGKVENPAFSNGFTSSEWAEMDHDERRNYLNGKYDVCCPDCADGKRRVPNVELLTFGEKRILARQRKEAREEAQWRREAAAERRAEQRMGC